MTVKRMGVFKIRWSIMMYNHFRIRSSVLEELLEWSQSTLSRVTCPERKSERVDVLDMIQKMWLQEEETV